MCDTYRKDFCVAKKYNFKMAFSYSWASNVHTIKNSVYVVHVQRTCYMHSSMINHSINKTWAEMRIVRAHTQSRTFCSSYARGTWLCTFSLHLIFNILFMTELAGPSVRILLTSATTIVTNNFDLFKSRFFLRNVQKNFRHYLSFIK